MKPDIDRCSSRSEVVISDEVYQISGDFGFWTHNGSGTLLLGPPVAYFETVDLTTVNFKHLLRIACGRLWASSPQASSLRNPVFLPTGLSNAI